MGFLFFIIVLCEMNGQLFNHRDLLDLQVLYRICGEGGGNKSSASLYPPTDLVATTTTNQNFISVVQIVILLLIKTNIPALCGSLIF